MALKSTQSRAILPRMFHMLREEPQTWVPAISGTPIDSKVPIETYADLGTVDPMREWDGPRGIKDLRDIAFSIRNKKFQTGFRVTQEERDYDQTGKVERKMDQARLRYNQHWVKLASQLIVNGESGLCYDGQPFFSANHEEAESGVQSNLTNVNIVGTPTAPTVDEFITALQRGLQTLHSIKDDAGEPSNEMVSKVLVFTPPSFMAVAKQALSVAYVPGGGTNPITADTIDFELVASLRFASWTTKFAMVSADGRALIRQEVGGPRLSAKAEGSDYEHDTDNHEYGISAVRNAGYGSWQGATLVTLS